MTPRYSPWNRSTTRRGMLQLCATAGALAALPVETSAADIRTLQDPSVQLGYPIEPARLNTIAKAVAQTLDQFQSVRVLQIDPLVEPATVFRANGHGR